VDLDAGGGVNFTPGITADMRSPLNHQYAQTQFNRAAFRNRHAKETTSDHDQIGTFKFRAQRHRIHARRLFSWNKAARQDDLPPVSIEAWILKINIRYRWTKSAVVGCACRQRMSMRGLEIHDARGASARPQVDAEKTMSSHFHGNARDIVEICSNSNQKHIYFSWT
jgi:hypothetical protein